MSPLGTTSRYSRDLHTALEAVLAGTQAAADQRPSLTNPRVPAILCLADTGWQVATKAIKAKWPGDNRGNHGFDPADPSMAAVFVAHGPAVRRSVTWPKFRNVDVYPLLAKLLGLKPLPSDGRLVNAKGMLASR